jgi:hypothetical protein
VGFLSPIAVDSRGRLHVVYRAYDAGVGSTDSLVYAIRDEVRWTTSDALAGGSPTSIVIGPDDLPRILVVDEHEGLEYATFDGVDWNVTVTGFAAHDFMGTSLVLDGDGHAHCTYGTNTQLSYASNDSGTWRTTALGNGGASASVALDAAGRPHIAAAFNSGVATHSLEHFWNVGGTWLQEDILDLSDFDPVQVSPGYVSLVADAKGRLVAFASLELSLGDLNSRVPVFAYFNGSRWRNVQGGPFLTGGRVSLAAGPDGAFHGVYGRPIGLVGRQVRYSRLRLPDLEATWTDFQSAAVAGGARVDGHVRVRNLGLAGSKPVRMTFYLSDDDVFDAQDQRVGRAKSVPGLRVRDWSVRVSFTVPGAASGKRLLAVIDDKDDDRWDDLVRANNIAAATIE